MMAKPPASRLSSGMRSDESGEVQYHEKQTMFSWNVYRR